MSCPVWPEVSEYLVYGTRVAVYRLEPGRSIPAHTHKHWGHQLLIADGIVRFRKGPHEEYLKGPLMLDIEKGLEHEVVAVHRSIVVSIFKAEADV